MEVLKIGKWRKILDEGSTLASHLPKMEPEGLVARSPIRGCERYFTLTGVGPQKEKGT